MARRIPPLPAIEAFLYAARARSFRAAADQLALSPSAFSRRVQTLEAFIGVALFERSAPPKLTDAGRRYYLAVADKLDDILEVTERLRTAPQSPRLKLMSPPSLATNWLMPKLSVFLEQHPGMEADIVIGRDLKLLRQGRADLALTSEAGAFPMLPSDPLVVLEGVVVASPRLAAGRRPPRSLDDLSAHRLLSLKTPADFWSRWLDRAGYVGPELADPTCYETWGLMYEAAANGFGVTIAVTAMANGYLREGRLAACFGPPINLNAGYRIAYASEEARSRPAVRRLADWLSEEMSQSRDEYRALTSAHS